MPVYDLIATLATSVLFIHLNDGVAIQAVAFDHHFKPGFAVATDSGLGFDFLRAIRTLFRFAARARRSLYRLLKSNGW